MKYLIAITLLVLTGCSQSYRWDDPRSYSVNLDKVVRQEYDFSRNKTIASTAGGHLIEFTGQLPKIVGLRCELIVNSYNKTTIRVNSPTAQLNVSVRLSHISAIQE